MTWRCPPSPALGHAAALVTRGGAAWGQTHQHAVQTWQSQATAAARHLQLLSQCHLVTAEEVRD